MNSQTIFPESEPNRPRRTPARVLWLFVVAFAAVTVLTVIQANQRHLLEETEAPTAVGDRAYFQLPQPVRWEDPVAVLEQATGARLTLYLAAEQAVELEDAAMRKVAWPREKFYLYQTPGQPDWFVKVAEGRYLPVRKERRPARP